MDSRLERFILSSIDSVEQCEILVTLQGDPGRWWTLKELSEELRLAESPTGRDLETLTSRGFLDVRALGEVRYRVGPVSADAKQALADLTEAYRSNRVEILSVIVRRKGRSMQHFAEAFDFRKGRA